MELITSFLEHSAQEMNHIFLKKERIAGDASSRVYYRVYMRSLQSSSPPTSMQSFILMAMPDQITQARLTYMQAAQLAINGESFLSTTQLLQKKTLLSVPVIYAHNVQKGFFLLEDFGDQSLLSLLIKKVKTNIDIYLFKDYYVLLINSLKETKKVKPYHDLGQEIGAVIPKYSYQAWQAELLLFGDFYLQYHCQRLDFWVSKKEYWTSFWKEMFALLPAFHTLTLRDYHSPNIMWLPHRIGIKKAGIIDYQDMVFFLPEYDIVSLLQDARFTIPESLEKIMIDYYISINGLSSVEKEIFFCTYSIVGLQRGMRILGTFSRLKWQDKKGSYMECIDRVLEYIRRNVRMLDVNIGRKVLSFFPEGFI